MGVDVEFLRALKEGAPRAIFADIGHPDGDAHLWSGIGDIVWRGFTYRGAGHLASVQVSKKSAELRIDEVTMTLGGVNPDDLAGLSDEIRGREADIWLVCLTPNFQVRGAMLIENMLLDYMTDSIGDDGMAAVTITAESGLWPLQRTTEEVWSPENQKLKYSTDTGLDLVPSMRSKQTLWLREAI
jgi:hypothetical protein